MPLCFVFFSRFLLFFHESAGRPAESFGATYTWPCVLCGTNVAGGAAPSNIIEEKVRASTSTLRVFRVCKRCSSRLLALKGKKAAAALFLTSQLVRFFNAHSFAVLSFRPLTMVKYARDPINGSKSCKARGRYVKKRNGRRLSLSLLIAEGAGSGGGRSQRRRTLL